MKETIIERYRIKEPVQEIKGIWIQQDEEYPLGYLTWLREKKDNVIGVIPFEHSYRPTYLGSVTFLNLSDPRLDFSHLKERYNLKKGLLQNKFYPLGGMALYHQTELIGKGLARRIEFEIAKDLSKKFPEETQIVIGASSDSHLEYCKRLGIIPFKSMTLKEYLCLLNHPHKLR